METPQQLLNEILKLLGKKRSDLLESEEFSNRINSCIEHFDKYALDIPVSTIEEVQTLMEKIYFNSRIWEFIIKMNKNPLPVEIGVLLPQHSRKEINEAIANSDQYPEVYFATADNSKYARSRLCINLFVSSNYAVEDLQKFIDRYGKSGALRVLKGRTPSSRSKYALFSKEEVKEISEKWEDELSSAGKKKKRKQLKRPVYRDERLEEEKRIKKE